MKRICVFCGSSQGSRPEYRAATEELGTELARRNIGLVYGGGYAVKPWPAEPIRGSLPSAAACDAMSDTP